MWPAESSAHLCKRKINNTRHNFQCHVIPVTFGETSSLTAFPARPARSSFRKKFLYLQSRGAKRFGAPGGQGAKSYTEIHGGRKERSTEIRNSKSPVSPNPKSAIRNPKSPVAPIRNPQFEISSCPQSEIRNSKSEISSCPNPKSAIRNPKSPVAPIRNPQFEI